MDRSPFHSAEVLATVNEHIENTNKKEMERGSAQGVSARWCGKSKSRANQNEGSGARGPLIRSDLKEPDALGVGRLARLKISVSIGNATGHPQAAVGAGVGIEMTLTEQQCAGCI
ncbi:hypothetical protein [Cereibacter sphaeroides]|uniref:hypothetical protein n=1 Tax=Cereibacter sphaeroides TaxID=1063 RepID=UPI00113198A6|nr:hypothetical protein [Cereibacter sphaeroides]